MSDHDPAVGPALFVVDTDPGVDDAAAICWLLTQTEHPVEVLGIATVAGNTTVASATANALALLAAVGRSDVPVVMGAKAPLVRPLEAAAEVHGQDGLWGASTDGLPLSPAPGAVADVADLYRTAGGAGRDAILLALGPLTNLATALASDPDSLGGFSSIVVLGGASQGGNVTAVAEFNFWQDPEAAQAVLSAGLPITLVPLDVFATVTFDESEIAALEASTKRAARFLARPLGAYLTVETSAGRPACIPDLVGAAYALDPSLGTARPALVEVCTDAGPERGRTLVDFASPRPNAKVVTSVDSHRVRSSFLRALSGG